MTSFDSLDDNAKRSLAPSKAHSEDPGGCHASPPGAGTSQMDAAARDTPRPAPQSDAQQSVRAGALSVVLMLARFGRAHAGKERARGQSISLFAHASSRLCRHDRKKPPEGRLSHARDKLALIRPRRARACRPADGS